MDGSTALTDPDGALTDPDVYIAMQFASTAISNPAMRSAILQCDQQPCNAITESGKKDP